MKSKKYSPYLINCILEIATGFSFPLVDILAKPILKSSINKTILTINNNSNPEIYNHSISFIVYSLIYFIISYLVKLRLNDIYLKNFKSKDHMFFVSSISIFGWVFTNVYSYLIGGLSITHKIAISLVAMALLLSLSVKLFNK